MSRSAEIESQVKRIWTNVFGQKSNVHPTPVAHVPIDVSSNGTTSVQPDELVKLLLKRFSEMKK